MMRLTGARVLVTGGAGYLGTNIARHLCRIGCDVVRLARPGASFAPLAVPSPCVREVHGDVRERATWETHLPSVDVVFHLAAQTSAGVANADPHADLECNVVPML